MAAQCFHEIVVLYAQSLSSVQLCDPMDCRLLCPWNSPGTNTGVDCHFLPQGIFLTQGSTESPALAGGFLTSEPPGKLLLMNFYLAPCVFVSRNKAAILGCVTGELISVRWSLWNRIAH